MFKIESLLKIVLTGFLGLLVMLQFFSFPGQFRYMAEQEPENAEWRWPLTIIVFLIIAAIQAVVILLWMIVNSLSNHGNTMTRLRYVELSMALLAIIWIVLVISWIWLLSIADDPGLPVLVTVIIVGFTAVFLLYGIYRKHLLRVNHA